MSGKSRSGFTLIELLVATFLSSVLVMVIFGLYINYSKVVINQEERIEIQQIGRAALQALKSDLEMIGRGVRNDNGQQAVVYAAPWELVFNADISPEWGALTDGATVEYGPDADDFDGDSNWNSDAETIHYFMVVPDTFEDFSNSDYDREIRKQVNDPDNGNAPEIKVAYGVRYDDGTMPYADDARRIRPLFMYWGDFDLNPATPDTLWGDSNSDGELSDAEVASLLTNGFNWTYTAQSITITNPGVPGGGIFLGKNMSNSEDVADFGILNPGEDLNGNGRLDVNLLDYAIHRIELHITTITQYKDPNYHHPHEAAYQFREHSVKTSVNPRNLVPEPVLNDCGLPPGPPTNPVLTKDECGRALTLTWNRSPDDGIGENDVLWYEIQRKAGSAVGTPTYRYYTFVAATGAATYEFIDHNISRDVDPDTGVITNYPHRYKISAVDCADQHSTWVESNEITPVQVFPNQPEYLEAWDSPCFKNDAVTGAELGSITLQWRQSLSGGSLDTDVDEYWIYRSYPSDTTGVMPTPIAKVDVSAAATCAGTSSISEHDAHLACKDQAFFKYTNESGEPIMVWRDELDSPGRGGGSLLPLNSHQFGIGGDIYNYYYEVTAYDAEVADECISYPAELESQCVYGSFCDIQSFDCSNNLDSVSRARYSPPRNLHVDDSTMVIEMGQNPGDLFEVLPAFNLTWDQSQNEFCEDPPTTQDGEIPDMERYYVYRTKSFIGVGSPVIDPNAPCRLKSGFEDDVLVFSGLSVAGTQIYEFNDNNVDFGVEAENMAFRVDAELEPYGTAYAPGTFDLALDPVVGQQNVYEYFVSGTHTDPSGSPLSPWSFGASCVVQGKFECVNECGVAVDKTAVSLNQCSLRSDTNRADDVQVFWSFLSALPDGSIMHLVASDANAGYATEPGDFFLVDDDPTALGGFSFRGDHAYDDDVECPYSPISGQGCVGQRPPTLWEYWLEITCENCTRYVPLGLQVPAGLPDPMEICFYKNDTGCDPDATFNCDTGALSFDVENKLSRCSGTPNTEPEYLWFRVARWSKAPSNTTEDYSFWPWCPNQTNPYLCGQPQGDDYPAEAIYYIRSDGTQSTYCGNPDRCGPEWTSNIGLTNLASNQFRLTDYVDPARDYWYMVELRVDHYSTGTGGSATPPYCCPGQGAEYCPPLSPWTRNADNRGNTCNGGYPINFFTYEHIQCYPTWTPDPYYPGTHNMEEFDTPGGGWELNIEHDSKDWKNQEFILLDEYFWGMHLYLGDHMFKYTASSMQSDMETFFNDMALFIVEWVADIGYGLCNWCIEFLGWEIFCVEWVWTECYDSMTALKNHSYVWSNFSKPSPTQPGVCGASNNGGWNQTLTGDFMWQFSFRSERKDKNLVSVFRGTINSGPETFDHYQFNVVFPGNANTVTLSLGYKRFNSYVEYFTNTVDLGTSDMDMDWWTSFILTCTNRDASDTINYDQTFIYIWTKPDGATPGAPNGWDWQQGGPSGWFYDREPQIEFNTIGKTAPGGGNLSTVENKVGAVGFWMDAFVDWEQDVTYYDNFRITDYCGQCPPQNLVPITKFNGKNMPDGYVGRQGVWTEIF